MSLFGKLFKKEEHVPEHLHPETVDAWTVYSPVDGEAVDITEVSDPVFAQKTLGEGAGIHPENGVVRAPADGVISALYPTGHAFGISTDNGMEILVHIGVDTVKMNGEGFDIKASQDQKVQAGDVIVVFDPKLVKNRGYDDTVMCTVTNTPDFSSVKRQVSGAVKAAQPLLKVQK